MALSRRQSHVVAAGALLVAALASCAQRATVQTLLSDPSHYDHQTVRITGTVKSPMSVFGYGAYQIDDGTGTLTVVAKQGGAPHEGAKVGVTGEFHNAFTLGAETVAVLTEKVRQVE